MSDPAPALFTTIIEDSCGIANGTVHAVGFQSRAPRRTTVDARCGRRVKYWVTQAVDEGGNRLGYKALIWPPRISALDPEQDRCQACMNLTGRPRPSVDFPTHNHEEEA